MEDLAGLRYQVEKLLVEYGGEALLREVGRVLQTVEGSGTAATIGNVIEELSKLDW